MVHTYVGIHEVDSELCNPGIHCFFHNKDEEDVGAYIYCSECGHVYGTKRELRKRYRKAWNDILAANLCDPVTWLGWITSRFRRVKSITFCQECLHDF